MINVAGSDQVTLKVRVVEVQRSAIKQLGFDTQAVIGRVGEGTLGAVAPWSAREMSCRSMNSKTSTSTMANAAASL